MINFSIQLSDKLLLLGRNYGHLRPEKQHRLTANDDQIQSE
jgi:hypothetical protein